jgi:hypothetical protein
MTCISLCEKKKRKKKHMGLCWYSLTKQSTMIFGLYNECTTDPMNARFGWKNMNARFGWKNLFISLFLSYIIIYIYGTGF